MAVGIATAFLMIIAVGTLIWMRGSRSAAAPPVTVQISSPISVRSADDRGTDAMATIVNPNPMPVDVTILVRGLDTSDRPVIVTTIGPFRNVPAGGDRLVETYLDATPLESVTFEAIAVKPVDLYQP